MVASQSDTIVARCGQVRSSTTGSCCVVEMEPKCACKGIRTCLACENFKPKEPPCSGVHKFNEQVRYFH